MEKGKRVFRQIGKRGMGLENFFHIPGCVHRMDVEGATMTVALGALKKIAQS